jgi:hypothetical protein
MSERRLWETIARALRMIAKAIEKHIQSFPTDN